MSGHSKWHNIQGRKGKQDAAKINVFSKYSKAISVTARSGGDPEANFALRILVEKAKAAGMPKDNIERAIKRGSGAEGEGAQIEEALYEAFGPGGVAVLVKTLTDNKNRTVSEVKHLLSLHGGSMSGVGSVLWMFKQVGVIKILNASYSKLNKDDFQLALIDAGAEDFLEETDMVEVYVQLDNLQKVLRKLKELGVEPEESGLQWVAKEKNKVDAAVEEKLLSLFAALEEHDDVGDYWTNAE